MKNSRQAKILELIKEYTLTTHQELQTQLEQAGFSAAQATISRDIKDLRLLKSLDEQGNYRYMNPQNQKPEFLVRFESIFAESVIGIDYSLNNVIIKCFSGMAQAACAALDNLELEMVLGTLAGDDTIIVVTKGETQSLKLVQRLNTLLG